MKPIEILLENYWIIKESNEENYNKIKQELDEHTQKFIKEKLGYKLIANPYLIKLEKIPGSPKEFMGICEFSQKLEYVFLCLILIYLETKSRKDQFILSQLIDYIQNLQVDIDMGDISIDFNLFYHRKAMVKVLKYIKDLGFIKLYDGDENKFSESIEHDVLYEVTGISKYFVRNFASNISDCNLYSDIYENEKLGLEQDKGLERRQRIYRRIFTENVIYNELSEDPDYQYIKQYKNIIEQDVDKILDASFEVHKSGAYLLLLDNNHFKNTYPSNKAVSDVVLFLNTEIIELYKKGILKKEANDYINISVIDFKDLIRNTKEKYEFGFTKEYKEKTIEELEIEIVSFMKEFDLLRVNGNMKEYIIMPMSFKLKGLYPKEYLEKYDRA